MTSLYVDDFKLGLDTRRSILAAEPGSLQQLDNCLITDGGEIEKAASFVQVATLPAGVTQGLIGTNSAIDGTAQLWTFAYGTPNAVTLNNIISTTDGPVPLNIHHLATQPTALASVDAVEEYGPDNFFVTGTRAAAGAPLVMNWWLGVVTTGFTGKAPLVSGQKLYRVAGPVVYFSGVGDPSVIDPLNPLGTGPNIVNPGAGFIDLSRVDSDADFLVGLEAYYKQVAIFSRRVCILYNLDPDPALNQVQQTLRQGAISNASIIQVFSGDVMFLADNGIRSLRALNAAMVAGVNDIGSPIDRIIRAVIKTDPIPATKAEAIVDPITGRYWLAICNVIYILSSWPSAKINAWSTITLPFYVDHMTVAGTRIYIRSGDNVYLYAGLNGATYDNLPATVRTPHMAAETPTTRKKAVSIDALLEGTWAMSVGMSPDNPDLYELAATVQGPTYAMQRIPFTGYGTHIGFKLTCTDAGPSRLGALSVSFKKTIQT
jgi:hypothetical protein